MSLDLNSADHSALSIAPAIHDTAVISTGLKEISARTANQDAYVRRLLLGGINFGLGPAGTGKTYLAVAAAVAAWKDGLVKRIVLSRPAVEAGERLGFLPGDMKEKVDPYMMPLYDALRDFLPAKKLEVMLEEGVIEVAPLAFMRGRTLANAAIVLDEAQNATVMQMKMFLTRLGEKSIMTITGDPKQVDLPRGTDSGLIDAVEKLAGIDGIHITRLSGKDVVRHPLVAKIVDAYEASDS